MEISYSPVQYVYREVIEEEIAKGTEGKVFYFNAEGKVDSSEGKVTAMQELDGKGLYVVVQPAGDRIRIDRIITLFGKPGAAFDEYDAFGNACLDCKGGYDFD